MGTTCSVCWTKKDEQKVLSDINNLKSTKELRIALLTDQIKVQTADGRLAHHRNDINAMRRAAAQIGKYKVQIDTLRNEVEGLERQISSLREVDEELTSGTLANGFATALEARAGKNGERLVQAGENKNRANSVIALIRGVQSDIQSDAVAHSNEMHDVDGEQAGILKTSSPSDEEKNQESNRLNEMFGPPVVAVAAVVVGGPTIAPVNEEDGEGTALITVSEGVGVRRIKPSAAVAVNVSRTAQSARRMQEELLL